MENNQLDSQKESVDTNHFSLLDVIVIILKNKIKILIFTGIFCIISIVLYFFVFDLIYYSTASIKSSGKGGGLLNSLTDNIPDIGGLDDLTGMGGGKSAKELATYEEILASRRCIEPLIDKFDLMNRDEFRFKEDAIKEFVTNRLVIKTNKLSGFMEIGVYDKNPVFSKEMVEFLLDELNKINIELNVQNAKSNREFIEKRFVQAKSDLTGSEDTLKAFQLIYGIAPDLQVKASAQSEFTLEAELKTEEVKLDVLKKILSPEQLEVKTEEAKISSLKNKISEIQNSTDLNDFLRLGNSPQIIMSFLRLTRDVEIQSKIVSFLLPLFEQAKIEEKRETPTILVLDKPFVAEKKSKPKRLTMVILWTFISFISVIVYSVIIQRLKYNFKKIQILRQKES